MKHWGIKKRVLFLALLPTLVIALTLASYFSFNRIKYIEESLHQKGELLANHLAPALEYGVFTGNTNILNNIIDKTLSENDVIKVTVSNASHETLISRKKSYKKSLEQDSILSQLFDEEFLEFNSVIIISEIDIEDIDQPLEPEINSEIGSTKNIGYVHVTMSNFNTRINQLDSILKAFFITLSGLILTIFLAIKISRGVVNPIRKLTISVNKIAQGDLHTHIEIDSGGEIGSLENGITKMNEEIQLIRWDLQTQVDKATAKLTKTLKELETQNIELDIARKQALSASEIKSEFLANMSHEIRTPMNGVLGFTNLLSETKLNNIQKDYVTTISGSAESLLTIINDILDFSKIESGKLKIENIRFNLQDLLNDVIKMFTPMARDKNIELIYHPYPEIHDYFYGDPSRIRQIIINLISNAIKFTDKGHVTIETISTPLNNEKINFQFTIADTGIGMDKENRERLFTAFSQADTSITRKFGGTGLGLVISEKLAELMSGDIGFESESNKGSTFWFSLPLKIDFSDLADTLSSSIEKRNTNQWSHTHVLLVDDNEINLKLAKTLLENHNVRVSTAQDGEQAMKLTDNNFYDIIFMDLHMPKTDGYQATEYIRKTNNPCQHTTIVALTANAMSEEQQRVYKSGMNDILLKPISENQIFDVFERWIPVDSNCHINIEPSIQDINTKPSKNMLIIYDKEEGKKLAGNNELLEKELFAMLIKELPEHKQKLEQAKSNNNIQDLKNHIHKLHGASTYCGVPQLRTFVSNLENIIDNSKIDRIESAYQSVITAIEELIIYAKNEATSSKQ